MAGKTENDAVPFGHSGPVAGPFVAVPLAAYTHGAYIAPAGDIHSSARDLARFALAHRRGLQGLDGILSAETIKTLHTPSKHKGGIPYAGGWITSFRDKEKERHYHNGTTGTFYASIELYPNQNRALVVLVNGMDMQELSVRKLRLAATKRYRSHKQHGH